MGLWHDTGRFPILYADIESMKQFDDTHHFLQSLDKLTPIISYIFKELTGITESNKSPRALQREICEFLCLLEPRGFLTCLGIRKTVGSQDTVLPPEKTDLEEMYNRLNKPLTEEEAVNNPNPSLLTVGARAVQKHACRPSANSGYWADKGSMNGMTEQQKNAKAVQVIDRIIQTSVWINIHTLHPSSHLFILEMRDIKGFGARWEIAGQYEGSFRGLIEP